LNRDTAGSRRQVEQPSASKHRRAGGPASNEPEELWAAVKDAARFDPTITVDPRRRPRILERYLPSAPYSRTALFEHMLEGKPIIVTGFPSPLRGRLHGRPPAEAGRALVDWLAACRSRERFRIYTGPASVRRKMTLPQIAAKWRENRTRFGVTDLHIRGTVMEDVIAPDVLSGFNLLPHSTAGAGEQEMFSFIISSRGRVTDSHSDDPDSSNFCFAGRKLWLAWDTYEGARHGLQDVERTPVTGKARFDMETWLSLRSARWFIVGPGETLFLPGHLTHKVVTLEPYIGVGSFYVALPNCLRLLAHWIVRGPLWSKRDTAGERDELVGEIAQSARDAILHLRRAPLKERQQWGYDFLERSAEAFLKAWPAARLRQLWTDPRFRAVADVIAARWPSSPSASDHFHRRATAATREARDAAGWR